MDIQVLGTTFNVCAYEKENIQTVVLVTGKVEVKTNNNETKTLSPNNLLAYNDQQGISVHPVDVQEYIAWKLLQKNSASTMVRQSLPTNSLLILLVVAS